MRSLLRVRRQLRDRHMAGIGTHLVALVRVAADENEGGWINTELVCQFVQLCRSWLIIQTYVGDVLPPERRFSGGKLVLQPFLRTGSDQAQYLSRLLLRDQEFLQSSVLHARRLGRTFCRVPERLVTVSNDHLIRGAAQRANFARDHGREGIEKRRG